MAGKLRKEKAIAAGRRSGKCLTQWVAVYGDGRTELRSGWMKTRV